MPLRGKAPEDVAKRLKMFLYGSAGSGKTTAAIQFSKPYVIDCEKGTENYATMIKASGGAVFQTTDMNEVIAEIRSLLTEKHEYRTLVIDPITTIFGDLVEKSEKKVGSEFGRHYSEANKQMKRMINLIMQLDMTVIITSHAKKEYGQNLAVLGNTWDAFKGADYLFDLVIELNKKGRERYGKVVKSRIETFPDGDEFKWSFDAIKSRYSKSLLEDAAKTSALATPEQVKEIKALLEVVKLPDGTVDRWLAKASVEDFADMSAEAIAKCIEYTKNRVPATSTAA